MKTYLSFVTRTLTVFNLFLPVCTAVCCCFGYKFSLFSYGVCAIVFAVLSVVGVVYSFISKEKISKKANMAMLAFLPLISMINWGLYLYESQMESVLVKICILICFICSTTMVIKYVRPVILKIASVAIAFLSILPITLFAGILLEPFPKITVLKTLPSPEGTYYAEISDYDVGTFGGNTLVHIHETKKLDFLVFTVTKKPECVYIGDWKEYETMQIYWEDEHRLVINEIEYDI